MVGVIDSASGHSPIPLSPPCLAGLERSPEAALFFLAY